MFLKPGKILSIGSYIFQQDITAKRGKQIFSPVTRSDGDEGKQWQRLESIWPAEDDDGQQRHRQEPQWEARREAPREAQWEVVAKCLGAGVAIMKWQSDLGCSTTSIP